jgi:peptide/nickel transport system substrate-binding protein
MTQARFLRSARIAAAGLAMGALVLTGCSANAGNTGSAKADASAQSALLTIPREDMGTFVRNFNPFAPTVAPMTQQAIYESLLIYNPAKGDTTPWLASEWKVAEDGKSITLTSSPRSPCRRRSRAVTTTWTRSRPRAPTR